jgi:hypothetical protein
MTKPLEKRLRALEVPTRQVYEAARERVFLHTLRTFGAELTEREAALVEPARYPAAVYEADCETLRRYREHLSPEKREREAHALMSRLYRELELRGAGDPFSEDFWDEDDGSDRVPGEED